MNKIDELIIKIRDTKTKNSEYKKLLRIKADKKLNFDGDLNDLISKTGHKVNELSRIHLL